MKSRIGIFAIAAVAAGLPLGTACLGQSDGQSAQASLEGMEGMWLIGQRGPEGRRGPPPEGDGRRRGPPQGGQGMPPGPPPGAGGPPQGDPFGADDPSLGGPDIEGLDNADRMIYRQMTPAGKAAFEAMDPHDLPANNCLSNGLPSLVGIPDLQEWQVDGDVLTIHYANFNTVRMIYLDGREPAGSPTLLGHSTGSFVDGEFMVTTTNLVATPGGLARNAPGSASRSYVEHYRLSADGNSVTGSVTIHDPEYLYRDSTRPIQFSRAPEGSEIPIVPCDVEASQRYLD